jgi:hypothetical protein
MGERGGTGGDVGAGLADKRAAAQRPSSIETQHRVTHGYTRVGDRTGVDQKKKLIFKICHVDIPFVSSVCTCELCVIAATPSIDCTHLVIQTVSLPAQHLAVQSEAHRYECQLLYSYL